MSSGFISEAEIAEQRRLRQEEWEKVRSADQPIEAPEEVYDPRSLFERLQEQKNKRDVEYEEAHKLKNMIKGLDDDEVQFLDLVDRTKMAEERKKNLEEEKEMRDFKAAVASLQEKSMDVRLKQELKQPQITHKSTTSTKNSQLKLLAGVVKKSSKPNNVTSLQAVKRKDPETEENKKETNSEENTKSGNKKLEVNSNSNKDVHLSYENTELKSGALKCLAVLPGLGCYEHSSDSECSSEEEEEEEEESNRKQRKLDILGRVIVPPENKEN